jgi:hypothetical protein
MYIEANFEKRNSILWSRPLRRRPWSRSVDGLAVSIHALNSRRSQRGLDLAESGEKMGVGIIGGRDYKSPSHALMQTESGDLGSSLPKGGQRKTQGAQVVIPAEARASVTPLIQGFKGGVRGQSREPGILWQMVVHQVPLAPRRSNDGRRRPRSRS